jgi:hypothetical protein
MVMDGTGPSAGGGVAAPAGGLFSLGGLYPRTHLPLA